MRSLKIKRLTTLSILSAIALILATFIRIPIFPAAPFLNLDPKDVVIVIGGFLYGPLAAMAMSIVVAALELPISGTGIYGAIMNALSSCVFACSAAIIYKKRRTIMGAVIGLVTGFLITVPFMLLWNYFIVPFYMFPPGQAAMGRSIVAGMLIPVFLPFNLIKYSMSSAITLLIYKPISIALIKSKMLPDESDDEKKPVRVYIGVLLAAFIVIITCILCITLIL